MAFIDESDRLLKISEVKEIAGMGASTIYRKAAAGEFPSAVKLSGGMVRWRKSDLDRWMRDLPLAKGEMLAEVQQ
ncbi:helix-turn-helix transcriptional regulator [Pseudochelatococcus sp. G4_1912]|uniref:helix-turn-helix transcriptional regulator n=1 Tax=Pseudochelatococcus sp. G4_1912 TaxID=3114288 RepID=UPI0039C62792